MFLFHFPTILPTISYILMNANARTMCSPCCLRLSGGKCERKLPFWIIKLLYSHELRLCALWPWPEPTDWPIARHSHCYYYSSPPAVVAVGAVQVAPGPSSKHTWHCRRVRSPVVCPPRRCCRQSGGSRRVESRWAGGGRWWVRPLRLHSLRRHKSPAQHRTHIPRLHGSYRCEGRARGGTININA